MFLFSKPVNVILFQSISLADHLALSFLSHIYIVKKSFLICRGLSWNVKTSHEAYANDAIPDCEVKKHI